MSSQHHCHTRERVFLCPAEGAPVQAPEEEEAYEEGLLLGFDLGDIEHDLYYSNIKEFLSGGNAGNIRYVEFQRVWSPHTHNSCTYCQPGHYLGELSCLSSTCDRLLWHHVDACILASRMYSCHHACGTRVMPSTSPLRF